MGVITSLFAHKVIAAAAPQDAPALLASVGLDPLAPADPKQMIEDTVYYGLLERLAETMDVTDLPLRTGASMRCDEYGAVGLAWKAAPTLRGSYTRVTRYARLWTSVVEYELQPQVDGTLFILHRTGVRRLGLRLSNEATLASAVAISREVSPNGFSPRHVYLKHPAPSDTTAHTAYFNCPVAFNAEHDALLLSDESLAQPTRLGDEGITRFLLSHLDAELAALQAAENTLATRTRATIARALSEGVPKLDDVARSLGLSARSLHRRLSEEGLSYQSLTDNTRRDLAEGMLMEETHSLSEIAFLTGFSEQSAFTRAFKRWTGQTPAQYRKARN